MGETRRPPQIRGPHERPGSRAPNLAVLGSHRPIRTFDCKHTLFGYMGLKSEGLSLQIRHESASLGYVLGSSSREGGLRVAWGVQRGVQRGGVQKKVESRARRLSGCTMAPRSRKTLHVRDAQRWPLRSLLSLLVRHTIPKRATMLAHVAQRCVHRGYPGFPLESGVLRNHDADRPTMSKYTSFHFTTLRRRHKRDVGQFHRKAPFISA